MRGVDVHIGELTDQGGIVAAEVDDTVILGAALQLARVFLRVIGHQNALDRTDHLSADFEALLIQTMLQRVQTFFLQFFRGVVGQIGSGRARALAIDERVGEIEADIGNQLHGLFEVLFGFAGETDDEVRTDADPRYGGAQFAQLGFVLQRRVVALHRRENPVRARLHWQVQVLDQFRHFGVGLDQAVGELQRMRRGVADAVDAIDSGDHADQFGQVGQATVVGLAAIAVDVLPEQGHFTHAVFGQVNDFRDHVVERSADLFATGVRHHAERAVLAATFHH